MHEGSVPAIEGGPDERLEALDVAGELACGGARGTGRVVEPCVVRSARQTTQRRVDRLGVASERPERRGDVGKERDLRRRVLRSAQVALLCPEQEGRELRLAQRSLEALGLVLAAGRRVERGGQVLGRSLLVSPLRRQAIELDEGLARGQPVAAGPTGPSLQEEQGVERALGAIEHPEPPAHLPQHELHDRVADVGRTADSSSRSASAPSPRSNAIRPSRRWIIARSGG